eukprot:767697-Hanusia_phi.AAC.1
MGRLATTGLHVQVNTALLLPQPKGKLAVHLEMVGRGMTHVEAELMSGHGQSRRLFSVLPAPTLSFAALSPFVSCKPVSLVPHEVSTRMITSILQDWRDRVLQPVMPSYWSSTAQGTDRKRIRTSSRCQGGDGSFVAVRRAYAGDCGG